MLQKCSVSNLNEATVNNQKKSKYLTDSNTFAPGNSQFSYKNTLKPVTYVD